MASNTIDHVSECSVGEIRLLVKILRIPPSNIDLLIVFQGILHAISELPTRLKRPNVFKRLFTSYAKPRAEFCLIHKQLSPKIVHSLFSLIALECGYFLNTLANNEHLLTNSQIGLVNRLRNIHRFWLKPDVFKKTFGEKCY